MGGLRASRNSHAITFTAVHSEVLLLVRCCLVLLWRVVRFKQKLYHRVFGFRSCQQLTAGLNGRALSTEIGACALVWLLA